MQYKFEPKCPLCESSAKFLWMKLNVCQCQVCGLKFRFPGPSAADLNTLYQTSWGDPNNQLDETGATSYILAEKYGMSLAKSLGRKSFEGLCILDFGAGRGEMLKSLQNLGAEVYAVEPFGFDFLRQAGFKVFRKLEELPEGIKFNGIISLDVIEHVPAPWVTYEALRKHLAPGGWLYISTPNAAGLNARFYRSKWRELYNRGHLFFFSPKTFELALQKGRYQEIRRLRWYINYHRNAFALVLHWLLQLVREDGELRYLISS